MNMATQFWADWWVQFAVAVGTIGAVVVALFGQAFRGKFFPPLLSLSLADPRGELTEVRLAWTDGGQTHERSEAARYYHLRVSNARRWSPAQQVQVVLLRVEEAGADGEWVSVWSGDIPLGWRHQEVLPSVLRTIGPEAWVDLCSVVKDKFLQIHPLIKPNNLETVRRVPTSFIVTVQARGNEADSEPLRLQISWDGNWHDGAQEMQRHLAVKVIPAAEQANAASAHHA